MTRMLCDHCLKLIRDPKRGYIFSAEKFGVTQTPTKIDRDILGDVPYAPDDENFRSYARKYLHKTEALYCSECMMTLWKHITEFAENSVTNMENK